ncbi:thioredoxin domain-containing protein 17 [Drosophila grimshawi]|uniref:Thioredoxin domain-containing protein 17 n=1 Tax=Drosophila grimshawi TaxID=7222 RepID=B4JMT4_DROGR|nr:thioredoxin domain-containing protein 17 [Drosophila grimshawi]EDV92027.1 GH24687 [Drosophila grimshawi]
MPQYMPIQGYKQLEDALKVHAKPNCLIYIYFFGEKDSNGQSWCPDCVAVEETVNTAFREYSHQNSLIFTVDVGNRLAWKDTVDNKFRQPPYSLVEIPTLIRWQGAERLAGAQLKKDDLLRLFFDEAKTQSATDKTVLCQ